MSHVRRIRFVLLLIGAAAAILLMRVDPNRSTRPSASEPPPEEAAVEGNCRLWGLIGPAPSGLMRDHLSTGTWNNFKLLSSTHGNGWGIVSFLPDSGGCALRLPLARRGGVAAGNPYDPDFDLSIAELDGLHPSAVLAHIRRASSGLKGIPDPHPFTRDGFAFAHNGLVDLDDLIDLLTRDDPEYLVTHPLTYPDSLIDSELYLLWLLKYRHQHPSLPILQALQQAVSILYARVTPDRLNFVLTRGDTLWACRCAGSDASDPLRYFPAALDPPSPFWIVCSTVVGSDSLGWGIFPWLSVGEFVPGRRPDFMPLMLPAGVAGPEEDPPVTPRRVNGDGLGAPRPNPGGGPFLVPILAADPRAPARMEVWNAAGALVWEDPAARPVVTSEGHAFLWPGCDRSGRAAPPGVYLCRIRTGGWQAERKLTVVR